MALFRDVPGTVPECVRICGFHRKWSNLDRALKIRNSVLLNSWDSFLVTLLSISLETCFIYSSLILETDVFRDWPFPERSSSWSGIFRLRVPLLCRLRTGRGSSQNCEYKRKFWSLLHPNNAWAKHTWITQTKQREIHLISTEDHWLFIR